MSFLKQERIASKKGERLKRRQRSQRSAMGSIMAEVIRMDTRKRLREATCITLSVDDSKRRKLIRYRCDLQLLSVFYLAVWPAIYLVLKVLILAAFNIIDRLALIAELLAF